MFDAKTCHIFKNDDSVCHRPAKLRCFSVTEPENNCSTLHIKHDFLNLNFESTRTHSMSAILSADDLNDFISPGVACIKPVETLPKQAPEEINAR